MQNEFEIRENGKVIKRGHIKKHTKAILKAIAAFVLDITYFLLISPIKGLTTELYTQIKLKVFDAVYKTHLFEQRTSGKRTQTILHAKRMYGLI